MADKMVRDFMESVKICGGTDGFDRVKCYINSFLPVELKNTKTVYDVMYGATTLDEVLERATAK